MSERPPFKVALIGWGAIARAVHAALGSDPGVHIAQVILRPGRETADMPEGIQAITGLDALGDDIDFVLECAGHEAVGRYGPACLERGIDFGVLSVGALADDALTAALGDACSRGAARLVVVPGAIGGIDALSAAGTDLAQVRYTGRKPPRAWAGSPAEATHDLGAISIATPVFRGSARDACLRFPKNANVVATVALAGIGFDRTEVELVADPAASGNSHRIAASGGGFDLDYTTKGPALAANPRTSALTALSAVRALRQRGSGLQV